MNLKYLLMNNPFNILTVVYMLFKSGWSVVGFPVENQDRPLNISVNLIIEDINSLNPLTMDFRLEFYLTQKWTLTTIHCQSTYQSIQSKEKVETNNNPIVLKGKDLTNIWLPDAFLYNAKQVGPTTFDDGFKSLIVQFDGLNKCSFTYSLRLSALIPCPMNFRWFPVDKQVCRVSIRSGSYPTYQMVYSWLPKGVIVETKVPLLQHSLKMNYFQMNATVHDQALFTWLIVDLTFIRIISYHVIQIYLPTIILMIISYCSLWMGNDIVAGRITLGVTTQLALITQFSGIKSRLPQVSYINALDVWMVSCMLFVFSTIIVTTLIIVINRHNQELTKQMQIDQTKFKRLSRVETSWLNKVSSYADNHQSCISNATKLDNINHKDSINYTSQSFDPSCDYENGKLTINDYSEKIDVSLRFIYPLTFLLFNTLYWITVLTST